MIFTKQGKTCSKMYNNHIRLLTRTFQNLNYVQFLFFILSIIKSFFIKSIFLFIDSFMDLIYHLLYHPFTYYFNFSFRHLTDLYIVRSLKKQYHSQLTCYIGEPLFIYIYLLFKPRGNPYAPYGHIKQASAQPDLTSSVRLRGMVK